MCNYTSSFIAGIAFSIRLILSVTMSGFRDFSLIVFVVLLFCFCQFRVNTIFFLCQMCSVFSGIFFFTLNSQSFILHIEADVGVGWTHVRMLCNEVGPSA